MGIFLCSRWHERGRNRNEVPLQNWQRQYFNQGCELLTRKFVKHAGHGRNHVHYYAEALVPGWLGRIREKPQSNNRDSKRICLCTYEPVSFVCVRLLRM